MAYFGITSSERRGMTVLSSVLLIIMSVGVFMYNRNNGGNRPEKDSLAAVRHGHRYYAIEERKVETFDFDPNTADSTQLLRLGFAPWQVRGIYKYRAMGGRYHEATDVMNIPGVTNELWERLMPHIRIDKKYRYVDVPPRRYGTRGQAGQTSQSYERSEGQRYNRDTANYPLKLRQGMTISLNMADTSQLKKIPGIGSYYAQRIVRYRAELGGFVSAEQLLEVEGVPADVGQWVSVDTAGLRKIDVNHATKSELVRHPYIRPYRAGDIWNYRHNYGPLHGIDDLRRLPNFTEADVERLRPYLLFR